MEEDGGGGPSRPRRNAGRSDKTKAVLEKLAAVKQGGKRRIDTLELKEEGRVYDMVRGSLKRERGRRKGGSWRGTSLDRSGRMLTSRVLAGARGRADIPGFSSPVSSPVFLVLCRSFVLCRFMIWFWRQTLSTPPLAPPGQVTEREYGEIVAQRRKKGAFVVDDKGDDG